MVDIFATRFFPPFAIEPPPVFWLMDPWTEDLVDALKKKPAYRGTALTLVNLAHRTRRADGAGFITQFGWNGAETRFAASMVKIVAMFASYQLRHNLELAMREVSTGDLKEVLATVERDWGEVVRGAVGGAPDFPQFEELFTFAGGIGSWQVDFSTSQRHHLLQMISHSNNRSSSVIIDRLGYQYINGALEAAGLYGKGSGGLWLGSNYAGRNWRKEPRSNLTHMAATSDAVCTFLTLLENDLLVSARDSQRMRSLMATAGTWIGEGLDRAKRPVQEIYGKVGLMGQAHDCAVVTRAVNGKTLRYALCVLTASSGSVIRELAVKVDDILQQAA